MHFNVGSKEIDLDADLPQLDTVHLNQEQMSNIISLSRVFVKFIYMPEGLYAYKPSQEFLDSIASFKAETDRHETKAAICYVVMSVNENKKRSTERQFLSKLGTLMV